MADEYISKQAFNNAIRDAVRKYPNTFYNGLEVARQIAHDMDAADVQPVRHGRWIFKVDSSWRGGGKYECSACKYGYAIGAYHEPDEFTYCPHCGAYMTEGGET